MATLAAASPHSHPHNHAIHTTTTSVNSHNHSGADGNSPQSLYHNQSNELSSPVSRSESRTKNGGVNGSIHLSISQSPVYPSPLPSFLADYDWNHSLPSIYGGSRKGAKPYQEDSFFSYISPSQLVYIGGIFDGHGGYNGLLASCTARDYAYHFFQCHESVLEDWTVEQWRSTLDTLFEHMHEAIRTKFLSETETVINSGNHSASTPTNANSRRYVDDKGIVRTQNGDPVHGGTTATVIVMAKDRQSLATAMPTATIITANVGDSTALLLPSHGQHSFLSVDHGPENPDEYHRVNTLDCDQHPLKLLFVYDKTNQMRKYDCPLVFRSDGVRDPVYVSNPWGHGLHPTNVRYEPAVYAVTPRTVVKDSTCIAMTRALGDFYAHQFGLSYKPSINSRTITIQRSGGGDAISSNQLSTSSLPPAGFTVVLASDGIWDCWKYEDLHAYFHRLLHVERKSLGVAGEVSLEESMDRAVQNFGVRHFDDACIVAWQFK